MQTKYVVYYPKISVLVRSIFQLSYLVLITDHPQRNVRFRDRSQDRICVKISHF